MLHCSKDEFTINELLSSIRLENAEIACGILLANPGIIKNVELSDKTVIWLLKSSIDKLHMKSLSLQLIDLKPNLLAIERAQLLWQAINSWNKEVASVLVITGADLSFRETEDSPSFLHVLSSSNSEEKHKLALLMIERNADITCRDREGNALLHSAIVGGSFYVAEALIGKGASIHAPVNRLGQYPLHVACRFKRVQVIRLLLHLGADVNVTDQLGQTPLSFNRYACDRNATNRTMIKHFVCLIQENVEINERDLNYILTKPDIQYYRRGCIKELNEMKKKELLDGLTYYCFFNQTIQERKILARRADINMQLRKKIRVLDHTEFWNYQSNLRQKYGTLRKFSYSLEVTERVLQDIFQDILPSLVIRLIVAYVFSLGEWYYRKNINCKCSKKCRI